MANLNLIVLEIRGIYLPVFSFTQSLQASRLCLAVHLGSLHWAVNLAKALHDLLQISQTIQSCTAFSLRQLLHIINSSTRFIGEEAKYILGSVFWQNLHRVLTPMRHKGTFTFSLSVESLLGVGVVSVIVTVTALGRDLH